MVLRELDIRESAILSPLAGYPTRAASHSSEPFGSRINISRSVSHPRFGRRLRHFSPFHFDKRVRLNAAEDAAALATLADAVVDAVILPTYGAVERRLTRRLRNAGPCDSLTSRRQIVLIEKLPRRRLAEFRG
jgi:hypothetical protein